VKESLAYLGGLSEYVVGIWIVFWAYRSHYALDYELDRAGHVLRWSVVLLGFSSVLLPGSEFAYVRVAGGVLGLAFLVWPNFAYHLRQLFKRPSTK
jgi:hypothetical protein